MSYTHKCIKPDCSNKYTDEDPDPYYCPVCEKKKKAIAEEINKRIASRPKKQVKTDYQIALEKGKTVKSISGGGGLATFVRASDLGIS